MNDARSSELGIMVNPFEEVGADKIPVGLKKTSLRGGV